MNSFLARDSGQQRRAPERSAPRKELICLRSRRLAPCARTPTSINQLRKPRERSYRLRRTSEVLKHAGLKSVFYEGPETTHKWLSWRRSLHEFSQLLFQN
jgi:hypothetical protein